MTAASAAELVCACVLSPVCAVYFQIVGVSIGNQALFFSRQVLKICPDMANLRRLINLRPFGKNTYISF